MPELPEVDTVRKGFSQVALHNPIEEVEVFDGRIIRNATPEQFIACLKADLFVDTYRQGKYFFGILESGASVLFHLGMTGDIIYYNQSMDPPRFERFRIKFKNGVWMAFVDQRTFSNIRYLDNYRQYLQEIKLGPDALEISWDRFKNIFHRRKAPLKGILMNQQLISGIGNLYADEICYQAKIHPASTAGCLDEDQRKRLFECTRSILQLAVDRDAYYQVYPNDWFWKWRKEGEIAPDGASVVRKAKVAGRTTYFAQGYQEMVN